MVLFHSRFKFKMSKSQTDHVAFKSAPSPESVFPVILQTPPWVEGKWETEAEWRGHIPATKGLGS